MHQIQVTAPEGKGEEMAKLAMKLGIDEVSVSEVFVYGPYEHKEQVSIQTDTPTAREFVEALMKAKFFNPKKYSFTSQTLPSLVSAQAPEKLTCPTSSPTRTCSRTCGSRARTPPATLLARQSPRCCWPSA